MHECTDASQAISQPSTKREAWEGSAEDAEAQGQLPGRGLRRAASGHIHPHLAAATYI